jgi:co-chaperonin GroES (HSP10)
MKLPTSCEKLRNIKMTEFDVSAVDLSGVLNTNAEEKAKQVPDPATYHLLCMLPKADEEMGESGILYKTASMMAAEELLSPVLFVAKIGPDAFKDAARFPSGPSCKVGDFVLVRPNTGTRMKIHGTEWRLINDDSVQAVVQDPRGIQRPN